MNGKKNCSKRVGKGDMASAADRFSTLEKVAIFLIGLGQEKAREILDGVDAVALQRLNATIKNYYRQPNPRKVQNPREKR